jgi:hypothetical protein
MLLIGSLWPSSVKDAIQHLALDLCAVRAGLWGCGHGGDVDDVAHVVAAARRYDVLVYGVLCYAEDGMLSLCSSKLYDRIVLYLDLDLHVLIALVV